MFVIDVLPVALDKLLFFFKDDLDEMLVVLADLVGVVAVLQLALFVALHWNILEFCHLGWDNRCCCLLLHALCDLLVAHEWSYLLLLLICRCHWLAAKLRIDLLAIDSRPYHHLLGVLLRLMLQ